MATYSANGSGSEFQTYLYSRVEVTRTDSDLECTLTVTCKVVSDGGSSSFISGRVSNASGGWNSWSSEQSVSAYGTTTLATTTFKKSRGSSASTFRCYAEIAGGGTGMYAGAHDSVYVDVSIPAIVYQTPNAPSACSATRSSGTKATVTWTNGAVTTLKPRTATYIERSVDGGAFAELTNVGASTTSYADTTVTAGHYYQYRVRAYNSAGYSSYATMSGYVVTTPNAPSSCSATRNSDAKATVTWTNGTSGTTNARAAVLIERQVDAGSWTQLTSLAASTATYADNSISANHRYRYRVRSSNAAGYSSYATSGYIYTTPAAPTAVSLDKTAATTVSVSATVSAPYATGWDVQRSTDSGATWSADIATNAALPVTDTVAGTVRYRVRSNRSNSLYSAWKSSSDITTIVPPDAPTITSKPANPSVSGSSATIKWTPNHPDGSTQSAAEIKVTDPGGTSTTYSVTTAKTYTFTPSSTGTWTAQVRTKGLDPSYGAWSSTVTWGVYDPPAVTIDSPATDGEAVTAMPLTISWTATDSTGISTQSLKVADGTKTLWSGTVASGTTSKALTISQLPIVDGGSYTITLVIAGGSGLSTTAVRTFTVAFVPPEAPNIYIEEAAGKSASITVEFVSGGVATDSVSVVRVHEDGTTWTVADNLPDGGNCIDPLPPMGVPVEYIAISQAASGATAQATATITVGGRDWALNFGDAAQGFEELRYNPQASYSIDHGGQGYHFADGGAGNGLPVWYGTTDRDESGTLKFDTVGQGKADSLRALCMAHPVAWLRDPFGHRWRAHVELSYSHGVGQLWPVSLDWQAMRFEEAWNG